ncbi:hypothetical protein Tcan_03124 [Toxocara canis]|uniref:Uncharacterized protein n=1 Tax=Toxocara canis TaxID=6265 RepID=A0A0B2W0H2_TOXCA|nr:hypothetical protein Tcan_03124 [Toxocara canis]
MSVSRNALFRLQVVAALPVRIGYSGISSFLGTQCCCRFKKTAIIPNMMNTSSHKATSSKCELKSDVYTKNN